MNKNQSAIAGAAFLMATSAIGPGFITQTTVFTQQLLASFGFVILCSVVLDVIVQLNIWRVIAVAQAPAQVLAERTIKGAGMLLTILVVFGGLAFNIGNVAGAGLGINIILGMDVRIGALMSAALAILVLWFRARKAMDWFAVCLGFVMIALTLFVVFKARPPLGEAAYKTFMPETIDPMAILTLVGGTVGGYISFAGAHRLLEAGFVGTRHLRRVTRGSITAILLASAMRVLLFLASLGAILLPNAVIDSQNPAASVFGMAAGATGLKIFGIVLWAAAISSVVGSAYTSVSFLRESTLADSKNKYLITGFIAISTIIFILVGRPVKVLVLAGALNGLVLPVSLSIILLASRRLKMAGYYHPVWLRLAGWLVVLIMTWMSIGLFNELPQMWNQ